MSDWVHEDTTWKTFFPTCGSVVDFLDDFVEAGYDILNPVQISARGMDPRLLKNGYGEADTCLPRCTTYRQTCPWRISWPCSRRFALSTARKAEFYDI
jgi:hypothetical protein